MSKFLELINNRIVNRNKVIALDPIPWELDDKIKAYQYVAEMGFKHPKFILHANIAEIFSLAKVNFNNKFVIKRPDTHSAESLYVLENLYEDFYLEHIKSIEVDIKSIISKEKNSNTAYWIAEEIIGSAYGGAPSIPLDYKFYCFNGQITHIIQYDRNIMPARVAIFDNSFFPLTFKKNYDLNLHRYRPGGHVVPLSAPKMISMCKKLSSEIGTKFVRIDCYDGSQGAIFGEFTFTPGAENVKSITYSPAVLKQIDAALNGEKIAPLSGFDINLEKFYDEGDLKNQIVEHLNTQLLNKLYILAAGRDIRYGNFLKMKLNNDLYSLHFKFILNLISFYNGDALKVNEIIKFIEKRESFLLGDSKLEEFRKIKQKIFNSSS